MNINTARTICNIAVIILSGYVFYITQSAWSFLILILLFSDPIACECKKGENNG